MKAFDIFVGAASFDRRIIRNPDKTINVRNINRDIDAEITRRSGLEHAGAYIKRKL